MNYKGKKIALTGVQGFIGNELYQQLLALEAYVEIISGDIRDESTFYNLNYEYDYLFHFAAPSSQVQFNRDPQYCIETTLKGFMNAADACKKHGIKLIYPSTGLLSMGDTNEYARCKKLCEDYVRDQDALGIRIFATYGPGESHKRDYASVPYLFARDIVAGKAPVVFGDGWQVRDFIYIDDVVNGILTLAEEANEKVIDLGSGDQISFNDVIAEINKQVKEPMIAQYVDKPRSYVEETKADTKVLHKYYKPFVQSSDGISKLIEELE